jgi:hypothetical protein
MWQVWIGSKLDLLVPSKMLGTKIRSPIKSREMVNIKHNPFQKSSNKHEWPTSSREFLIESLHVASSFYHLLIMGV